MSKIKNEKGVVTFVMRTGKTFVRNQMMLASAKRIINCSKNVEETDKRGYGVEICVDDKYFFPTIEEKSAKVEEPSTSEVAE